MTSALTTRTGLPGELRRDGYTLPAALTFDEWRDVLGLAEYIAEASPWWLCDAMRYGELNFPDQHSQALPTAEEDPAGARQSRLKQAAWMGQKFPPSTRVTGLSYTHHRVVADLEHDDRQMLLREAVSADPPLSTRALIQRVADRKQAVEARVTSGASEPACAADSEWTPSLSDLLPEWRERAVATGQPMGYLTALVDTAAEACFTFWGKD